MKNKFKWISIVVAAMLIFGFTGCEDPATTNTGGGKSKAAVLTAITFGDGENVVTTELKAAIPFDDYETGRVFPTANIGSIVVKNNTALAEAVNLTISPKAKALVARGSNSGGTTVTGGNYPPEDDTIDNNGKESGQVIPSLATNDHIVVRVTSEDGKVNNYYVFKVEVQGGASTLSNFIYLVNDDAQDPTVTIDPGEPATGLTGEVSWADVTRGALGLSGATKTGRFNATGSSAVDPLITKEFAVAEESDTVPTTFSSSLVSRTWKDGDHIFIRVTSQNGANQSLYIIAVELGRDANLTGIKFTIPSETNPSKQPADPTLGTPNANAANITAMGFFEPGRPIPTGGLTIAFTTRDADASAKWAKVAKDVTTPPTSYSADTNVTFANGDFFFVEVTSASTTNTVKLYYKIEVILQRETTIYYGQPVVRHESDRFYIDPLWTTDYVGEIMDVSRVNLAEMVPGFGFFHPVDPEATGHTMAKAKTYWDDNGLYIYMDVDIYDFYASQDDMDEEIVTTRTIPFGTPSQAHTGDNVEIFTNERLQAYQSGDYGIQYRVRPQEYTTELSNYGIISGTNGSGAGNAYQAFQNSQQFTSWIKMQGSKQVGYVVIARVPWIFVSSTQANEVFKDDGTVNTVGKDKGPTIGLELQLNTGIDLNSRDSILTWNGIRAASYQNAGGYGTATLIMGEAIREELVAEAPVITTQPASREFALSQLSDDTYTQGLTVVATESGKQTYKWFKSDATGANGVEVTTGMFDGNKFKPAAAVGVGTHYYYVIVTNTRGNDSKSVTSNVATVTVVDRQPTPADDLLGTRGTFERTSLTVLYGSDFDALAKSTAAATDPYANDNFAKRGDANAKVGYDLGVVWFTGSTGSGSNALQILKPNAITMDDPLSTYKLMIRGRTNAAHNSGRLTLLSTGSSFPDNTMNPSGANAIPTAYNVTLTLTQAQVTNGFWLHANTWGGAGVGTVIFSVDDLIIVKEAAPVITNFAFTIKAPAAGEKAVTTVENTQLTGVVTWIPALEANGTFAVSTEYQASIKITAKTGWQIATLTDAAVFTINAVNSVSYDPDEFIVLSAKFPETAATVPECPDCNEPQPDCTCEVDVFVTCKTGFAGVTQVQGGEYLMPYGIQKIPNSDISWNAAVGQATVTLSSGQADYCGIALQTGTAAGGTGWHATTFSPIPGRTYKVYVMASSTETGAQLRIQPNMTATDAQTFSLTSTATEYSHTFVQTAGNLGIDYDTSRKDFTIHAVWVVQVGKYY